MAPIMTKQRTKPLTKKHLEDFDKATTMDMDYLSEDGEAVEKYLLKVI